MSLNLAKLSSNFSFSSTPIFAVLDPTQPQLGSMITLRQKMLKAGFNKRIGHVF